MPAESEASTPRSGTGVKDEVEEGSRAGSANDGRASGSKGSLSRPATAEEEEAPIDMRNMRRIIAEDPEWSLATVPLLGEICLKHIVGNFEYNSKILDDLLPKHHAKVLAKIDTSLPLKITANLVSDQGYWERCCKARWNLCDVSQYDGNWKRMFFERNLENIIENFVPEQTNPTLLNDTLALSAQYVERLVIKQLLPPVKDNKALEDDASDAGSDTGDGPEIDHFDFTNILPKLPMLREFSVTFGVKDCGMNFEWNLYQFTARDCLLLAKTIKNCKNLKKFTLHRSKVDDEKVRVLISHIMDHPGLEELNLSHNLIGDKGARALGKFLNNHSKLVKLNISDNCIRTTGAMAIGHALTKNTLLKTLDMRLNRLADDGGQAICKGLLVNTTLTEINLASNDMTEPTAAILCEVVSKNKTLTRIDLGCNRFGPDGGKQLQEGMEDNKTIQHMDLRLTECGQESEYSINQILESNREEARDKSDLD